MHKINAKTTVCAVIGNPIEHSLSPDIHNAAFAAAGINWAYVAFRVESVQKAIDGIRALNIKGVSVTIPHKIEALRFLDSVDETALKIGSINTIVHADGHLKGYNSDGEGALKALRDAGHDPAGKKVVMLGSGGAARAIAFTLALKARPKSLSITGIAADELARLAGDIKNKTPVSPLTFPLTDEAVQEALATDAIIINCTPVGMYPKIHESPVPAALLKPRHAVLDIVYNPLKTKLLQDAEKAGASTISGIEMFLNQAVIQFELWTGMQAPKEVMRQVLIKHFT